MTLRRFFIFAILASSVTGLIWLMVPGPVPVRVLPLAEIPWILPVQPVSNTQGALLTLSSANLWGKLADSVQPSEREPEWRFIGTLIRGQDRKVIIMKDNQPEQTLAVGDSLPGGSKIISIDSERLCLLINGQKRSLYIYPQGRLSGIMSYLPAEARATADTGGRVARQNQ